MPGRKNGGLAGRQPRRAGPHGGQGTAGLDGALPRLKAFYEFMTQNSLESLELSEGGFHVRLVRRGQVPVPVPIPMGTAVAQPIVPAGQGHGEQATQASPAFPPGATAVKAPMMGIFYRAASPSSPPFAKEGDSIRAGQVLCIVEAMKVFNEIKAEFGGTVLKVLVENGKPVKSGQDLFMVLRG
jgi:acetyl-CoA carboxylase biotin carboxyl carrier protein